jgi:hypothetical protein
MTAKRKPIRNRGTVSRAIEGKTYRAAYVVSGSPAMITVTVDERDLPGTVEQRTDVTQLGDSSAEPLARIMVRQLVERRRHGGEGDSPDDLRS